MNGRCCILLLLAVLAGCDGPPTDVPVDTPAPVQSPPAEAPAPTEATPTTAPRKLTATVRVVDLSGTPLPQMVAIVTKAPNAFDTPVATGTPTDAQGLGTISFPTTEDLFLRAWDPARNYFPNNFYEVLAGGTTLGDDLVIQMVPAAQLSAQFILPEDHVAADTTVGLMLYHPTRGPWWPAEGVTNSEGVVTFTHLPAGEYSLRFKAESGPRLEYAQTALPPGLTVDLGILTLE